MAAQQSLPPYTIHSDVQISQSNAASFMSSFLAAAAIEPALQPNSILSERGPISRSAGAAPNLVLHNLKRVEAGLRGEFLGADLSLGKEGEDSAEGSSWEGGEQVFQKDFERKASGKMHGQGEGWQDRGEFEREQSIEQGELGDRGVGIEGKVHEVVETMDEDPNEAVSGEEELNMTSPKKPRKTEAEKADRKQRKKEKRKAEKQAKDMAVAA